MPPGASRHLYGAGSAPLLPGTLTHVGAFLRVHAFTVHAFTVHAFTVHAFTLHAFTVNAFTVHAFTVHAFTVHALKYPHCEQSTTATGAGDATGLCAGESAAGPEDIAPPTCFPASLRRWECPPPARDINALHAFTVHAFTVHAFTVHAFTAHAFTAHAFTVHAFTVHAFTVHAFTAHAGSAPLPPRPSPYAREFLRGWFPRLSGNIGCQK
ncbi:hypothetical protein Bbelb_298880 [Branchiostoma belcheri]|nr:hypothetical protein Bbelb_298880 [Branchiostoma belcheri]